MKTRLKALSPIIATILLVVIAVILVSAILSFGKNFTTKGLNQTKDVKDLSKSDAEHFIYPKTFSDGVIQFSYSPPNNFGDINITKYKILYDNNETEEVTLDTAYTLKTGTNLINLKDFSDQNVTSNKFTLILETEDNKYVTLKNITNPYPYVALPAEPLTIAIFSPNDNTLNGYYIYNSYLDYNATITGGTGEYTCSWELKRHGLCLNFLDSEIITDCNFTKQIINTCSKFIVVLTVTSGEQEITDTITYDTSTTGPSYFHCSPCPV